MNTELIASIRASFGGIIEAINGRGDVSVFLEESRKLLVRLCGEYCEDRARTARFILLMVSDALSNTPLVRIRESDIRLLDSIVEKFGLGRTDGSALSEALERICESNLNPFSERVC